VCLDHAQYLPPMIPTASDVCRGEWPAVGCLRAVFNRTCNSGAGAETFRGLGWAAATLSYGPLLLRSRIETLKSRHASEA
jgi:hypothetical protein